MVYVLPGKEVLNRKPHRYVHLTLSVEVHKDQSSLPSYSITTVTRTEIFERC